MNAQGPTPHPPPGTPPVPPPDPSRPPPMTDPPSPVPIPRPEPPPPPSDDRAPAPAAWSGATDGVSPMPRLHPQVEQVLQGMRAPGLRPIESMPPAEARLQM